jgi:hypothetical protein
MFAWMRGNIRMFVLISILWTASILLSVALFSGKAECYIKCSPVIEVMNYSYFQRLLGTLTRNYLVAQFKTYLAEKLDIEYMAGSFLSGVNKGLNQVTNFSPITDAIMNEGLASEINFVKSHMNVQSFAGRLNAAVVNTLSQELKNKELMNGISRHLSGIMKKDFSIPKIRSRAMPGKLPIFNPWQRISYPLHRV